MTNRLPDQMRVEPAPDAAELTTLEPPADPILKGAAAIARYLSPAPEIGPPMSTKQIYRMIENGAPFRNIPGLGVAVRISTLKRYLDDKGA